MSLESAPKHIQLAVPNRNFGNQQSW